MKVVILIMSVSVNLIMLLPLGFAGEVTGARLSPTLEKGLMLMCQLRYNAADQAIAKLVESVPKDFVALCIHTEIMDTDPSIPDWKTMVAVNAALDVNPNSLFEMSKKAALLKRLGNKTESESQLTKVMASEPKENDWLDQLGRARAYNQTGDKKGALVAYAEALRLAPDSPVLASYLLNARSLVYNSLYDYDKAVADCDAAITRNPENAFAFGNRSGDRIAQQKYTEAIQDATEALRINSDYTDARNVRTVAYSFNKDYKKAFADANEVLKRYPNNYQAIWNRAQILTMMRDYNGARADARKLEQLDPIGNFGTQASQLLKSLEGK
jgi:tetratricopeptide (TPR) repeat protein